MIPAGDFLMGSPNLSGDASGDEKPQHRVRITQPFYLGIYEVTQAEYECVMEFNPSGFKESGPLSPVEYVSWDDAAEFCRRLSEKEGMTYRLPTESEWEYACRAGSVTHYSFGDGDSALGEHAWYIGNSEAKTHAVGQKRPNAWGLWDMHGNVWEWCADWYGPYDKEIGDNPTGPSAGTGRVYRGGGWTDTAEYCRSARRYCFAGHGGRGNNLGFRIALETTE